MFLKIVIHRNVATHTIKHSKQLNKAKWKYVFCLGQPF